MCFYSGVNAYAEAIQFKSMIVIHSSVLLGGKVHRILFTKESRSPNGPRGLAERHKAAVALLIASGDRVLMIIARTMPCMCQTIGK